MAGGSSMRLGEKDPKPYEIEVEDEKEGAPSDPEPTSMRHEPRRELILRAPIRLCDGGRDLSSATELSSYPRPRR